MELAEMRIAVAPYLEKLAGFETSDQIRDFLVQEGVKANRMSGNSCAIAQYVRQGSGVERITTGYGSTFAWIESGDGMSPKLIDMHTHAMTAFVHRFDKGLYPELVA